MMDAKITICEILIIIYQLRNEFRVSEFLTRYKGVHYNRSKYKKTKTFMSRLKKTFIGNFQRERQKEDFIN